MCDSVGVSFHWTATLYKSSIAYSAPMLYALGFIGLAHWRPHRIVLATTAGSACDGRTSSSLTFTTSWWGAWSWPIRQHTIGGQRSPARCIGGLGGWHSSYSSVVSHSFPILGYWECLTLLRVRQEFQVLNVHGESIHPGGWILASHGLSDLVVAIRSECRHESMGRDRARVANGVAAADG